MEPQWARSGSGSRVWVFYSKRGLLKNNNWEVSTTKASAVDNEDNLILDHDRITKVWHDFLYNKFAVTETEHARDAYADLGPQLVADPLTESKDLCVSTTKTQKGLLVWSRRHPASLEKSLQTVNQRPASFTTYLVPSGLKNVPPELVRSAFVMIYKNKGRQCQRSVEVSLHRDPDPSSCI